MGLLGLVSGATRGTSRFSRPSASTTPELSLSWAGLSKSLGATYLLPAQPRQTRTLGLPVRFDSQNGTLIDRSQRPATINSPPNLLTVSVPEDGSWTTMTSRCLGALFTSDKRQTDGHANGTASGAGASRKSLLRGTDKQAAENRSSLMQCGSKFPCTLFPTNPPTPQGSDPYVFVLKDLYG